MVGVSVCVRLFKLKAALNSPGSLGLQLLQFFIFLLSSPLSASLHCSDRKKEGVKDPLDLPVTAPFSPVLFIKIETFLTS